MLANISYDSSLIVGLASDIVQGLKAMHDAGFSHTDVKPATFCWIMVKNVVQLSAVLTDFGISQIVSNESMLVSAFQKSKVIGASVGYAAPKAVSSF